MNSRIVFVPIIDTNFQLIKCSTDEFQHKCNAEQCDAILFEKVNRISSQWLGLCSFGEAFDGISTALEKSSECVDEKLIDLDRRFIVVKFDDCYNEIDKWY